MLKTYDFENSADYTKVNTVVSGGKGKLGLINNPGQMFSQDFANDTGFTYDNTKSEFSDGKVRQKAINVAENYNQGFDSDVGFTYDAAKVEFASGLSRQKSQRPAGATCCAKFDINQHFNWADGSLAGGLGGDAAVIGGKLDLRGAGEWYFNGAGGNANAGLNNGETICYRLHYFPGYTGAPISNQNIMEQACTGNKNTIFIVHRTANDFSISVYDSSGVEHVFYTSTVSMVADTEYVLELNIDFTGITRFYVNGVLKGSLNTSSWTRSNEFISTCYFNRGGSANGNFQLGDVILFNNVQHAADHAGELPYSYPSYTYLETIVQCPIKSYLYNILSLGAPTITEVNAPKYVVNGYYWDGSAWIASSNTYATAMTYAQWVANIATFPGGQLGSGVVVKVIFQGSNTLGSIDSIAFEINETRYLSTNVILPELAYTGLGTLISFDDFETVEGGTPRYTLQIGRSGNYLYWDGSAWVNSNNTYEQANTEADFLAHVETLPVLGEVYGQFRIFFQDSNTQSYVDNLSAELTQQQYATQGTFLTLDGIDAQVISGLTANITESGDNEIFFVMVVDGVSYYYNTVDEDWQLVTDPYTQNNTLAELLLTLPNLLSANKTLTALIVLKSEDGTESPEIEDLTVTYTFGGLEPLPADSCRVYGYVKDLEDEPIENAVVTIEVNIEENEYCEVAKRITSTKLVKNTNDDGYFEFILPWTSEFDTTGTVKYKVSIVKDGVINITKKAGEIIEFTIDDDLTSLNLTEEIAMA